MSPTHAATVPMADGAAGDAAMPGKEVKASAVRKKAPASRKPAAVKKPAAAKKPVAVKKAATAKPAAAKKAVAKKTVAIKPVAAKPAAAKKVPAKLVKTGKAKIAAKEIAKDAVLPKEKQKKHKLVRDSFSMPEAEYAVLGNVKKACLKAGVEVKKSELLRIGVALIQKMDVAALKSVLATLPPLKAGRPKQEK